MIKGNGRRSGGLFNGWAVYLTRAKPLRNGGGHYNFMELVSSYSGKQEENGSCAVRLVLLLWLLLPL